MTTRDAIKRELAALSRSIDKLDLDIRVSRRSGPESIVRSIKQLTSEVERVAKRQANELKRKSASACPVCADRRIKRIDQDIASGSTDAQLARKYGILRRKISSHRAHA